MISTKDLYSEINILEDVVKNSNDKMAASQLKASVLQIKLLHNIRTNMVLVMKKMGVEPVKPKEKEEQE